GLLADAVVFHRLAGCSEVAHQPVHDVRLARLLELGQDDFLGVGLGVSPGLADQARRPQAQHLVLARRDLELKLLVVLELLLEGLLALVERGHGRSRLGSSSRYIAVARCSFHPVLTVRKSPPLCEEPPPCRWKTSPNGSAAAVPWTILSRPSRCVR